MFGYQYFKIRRVDDVMLLQGVSSDAPLLDSSSLPLEHRAVYGPPLPGPPAPQYGPPPPSHGGGGGGGGGGGDDPWPLATPDMPQIKHLQVQCEKTHMRVNIEFDRPFYGMIFSKGTLIFKLENSLAYNSDQMSIPISPLVVSRAEISVCKLRGLKYVMF